MATRPVTDSAQLEDPARWLELPELTGLGDALASTAGPVEIGEAAGSMQAIAAAYLTARAGLHCLLVTLDEQHARDLTRDLRYLLGPLRVAHNPALDYGGDARRAFEGWSSLGERVALLARHQGPPRIIVSSLASALERCPSSDFIARASLVIERGAELDLEDCCRWLIAHGHRRVPLVGAPGDFAVRGGILDIYPYAQEHPVRVELFGDEVDALRQFEPTDQRSVAPLDRVDLLGVAAGAYMRARQEEDAQSLFESLEGPKALVLCEPQSLEESAEKLAELGAGRDVYSYQDLHAQAVGSRLVSLATGLGDEPAARLDTTGPGLEIDDLTALLGEARSRSRVVVLARDEEEERQLAASIERQHWQRALDAGRLAVERADLGAGFRLRSRRITYLSAAQLLRRVRSLETRSVASGRRGKRYGGAEVSGLGDLQIGQLVVHVVHGIGRFTKLAVLEHGGVARDQLVIEYRDGALLYVPVDRIGLVRHYVGASDAAPSLSKLGGRAWARKKSKAEAACADLAAELLELQAARSVRPGHRHEIQDEDIERFEASFPYPETDHQTDAVRDVKDDLGAATPMDRLICGDVGFGKTEVALRAAFIVAQNQRQIALLAPTTVLAHQHARTFKKRFQDTAVVIDVLSRFRTGAEQRRIVKDLKAGAIDVLIGTHRLVSKDVAWRDLGLVIIDEEQRFGVTHKEALKSLRKTVDVLTMSATPIPRTLHMALSGARDISVIASPPRGRIPVRTVVTRSDAGLIKRALEAELARGGQAFVVHDRVRGIEKVLAELREMLPEASIELVHGQLEDARLERTMLGFVRGDIDILVATKIIENGLDVPRANTLIVNRADRFGLAELHQLRGRVGRHRLQAHAYFLLPRRGALTDLAERRLRAIEEYDQLGAGFRIALRDLELRGAGHLLGAKQSGHIADVGYDLYCRLLRKAVDELRKRKRSEAPAKLEAAMASKPKPKPRRARLADSEGVDLELDTGAVEIGLKVGVAIPEGYLDDVPLKIELYRKLAAVRAIEELEQLHEEVSDRFGPPPEELRALLALRALRLASVALGIRRLRRQDKVIILNYDDRALLQAGLHGHRSRLRWIEQGVAHLLLDAPHADDRAALSFLLEVFSAVDRAGMLRVRRSFGMVSETRRRPRRRRAGSN